MGGLHKDKKIKILAIIMLVTNNKPQGYKENVIYFITITLGEYVNIFNWLANY